MKTSVKLFLLVFLISSFFACEKTEVQEPEIVNSPNLEENIMKQCLKSTGLHSPRTVLYLDGIDDYIQIPGDPSLDMTNSFTVAAWIYMESYVEWASVVTKGGVPDGSVESYNNYTLHQSGNGGGGSSPYDTEYGLMRFTTGCFTIEPPLPESGTVIPLNEWHYITMTFDGTTLRFYLDGIPDGSYPLSGSLCTNEQPLNIGADFPGGDEYWHGAIDELRIWNITLTDEEVMLAMAGTGRLQVSNLVGYWHFNEGFGTVLHDYSGLGNDGTIMGGALWIP